VMLWKYFPFSKIGCYINIYIYLYIYGISIICKEKTCWAFMANLPASGEPCRLLWPKQRASWIRRLYKPSPHGSFMALGLPR
jgi:hypothetical protein